MCIKTFICIYLRAWNSSYVKRSKSLYPTLKKIIIFIAEGILPHEDLPPQCGPTWRDLRQHPQEGLETRPRHQGDIVLSF
jgi:hypothetical protein